MKQKKSNKKPKKKQPEKLLRITEFSLLLGVSVNTLRRYHANGRLIPFHVLPSGDRRYSKSQLKPFKEVNVFETDDGKFDSPFTVVGDEDDDVPSEAPSKASKASKASQQLHISFILASY